MSAHQTRVGRYETTAVAGENIYAYIPVPLPPNPPVDLTGQQAALELANQTLGRLLITFLRGVIETARQGIQTAQSLLRLFGNDRTRVEQLGRPAATALRLHELYQSAFFPTGMRAGLVGRPRAKSIRYQRPGLTSQVKISGRWYYCNAWC